MILLISSPVLCLVLAKVKCNLKNYTPMMTLTHQRIKWGKCPDPAIQASFDPTTYALKWITTARLKGVPWEDKDCPMSFYRADGTNKFNTFHSKSDLDGKNLVSVSGKLDLSASAKGKMNSPWLKGDYRVLKFVVADNAAIVYSCQPCFFFWRREYVWLLAKYTGPTNPDPAQLETGAQGVINGDLKTKISTNPFTTSDFEYPKHASTCGYPY